MEDFIYKEDLICKLEDKNGHQYKVEIMDSLVIITCIEQGVKAGLTGFLYYDTEPTATLATLHVKKELRGKGFGSGLLDVFEKVAKKFGAYEVYGFMSPIEGYEELTKKFYEKNGYFVSDKNILYKDFTGQIDRLGFTKITKDLNV